MGYANFQNFFKNYTKLFLRRISDIVVNTKDHLDKIISSNYIFQAETVVEIEEQFDCSSKSFMVVRLDKQSKYKSSISCIFWECFKRLVEKCFSW